MKRLLMLLGLVFIPALAGAGVYWRRHALPRELARARAELGTRDAHDLLERLEQACPDSAQVHYLCAQQRRLEGRQNAALVALGRAAELGLARPLVEREQLLILAIKDFPKAEPGLQVLLDEDPTDRDVLLALALGATRGNRYAKADLLVQRILDKDPNDGAALCLRGRNAYLKRDLAQARQDLEKAVNNGRGQHYYATARGLLAACYLDLYEYEDSLRLARESLAEHPDDVEVLYTAGRCCMALPGHDDEAARYFEAILVQLPDNIDALLQLAALYERKGELKKALAYLERTGDEGKNRYEVHFRMAKIYRALGDTEKAAEHQKIYETRKSTWFNPTEKAKEKRDERDAHTEPLNPLTNKN